MEGGYKIDRKANTEEQELRRRFAVIRVKFPTEEPEELFTTDAGRLRLAYLWNTIKYLYYDEKEQAFKLD